MMLMMMHSHGHVEGHLVGKDVLVWSAEGMHAVSILPYETTLVSSLDAEKLCSHWRVVGGRIGALPRNPRQNVELGLPLLLLPEEVALLCNKGKGKWETKSPS